MRQITQQHAEGGARGVRVAVEHAEGEEPAGGGQQRHCDGPDAPADTRTRGQYRKMVHIHGDGHDQHHRRQRGGDQQLQQGDPQFGVDRHDGAVQQWEHYAIDKREGYGQAVEHDAHARGQLASTIQAPREDGQGDHQQDGPGPHAGHREMIMLCHRHAAIRAHVVGAYVGQFLVADKSRQEETEGGQRAVMRTGYEREDRSECEDQLDGGDQATRLVIRAVPPLLVFQRLFGLTATAGHQCSHGLPDQCGGERAVIARIAAEQQPGQHERVTDQSDAASPQQ